MGHAAAILGALALAVAVTWTLVTRGPGGTAPAAATGVPRAAIEEVVGAERIPAHFQSGGSHGERELADAVDRPSATLNADAAAARVSTGALVVWTRWGDDGTPAPGRVLTVARGGGRDPHLDVRVSRSGVDGRLLLLGLEADAWSVVDATGAAGSVTVVEGATAELVIDLPRGTRLLGRVVDTRGLPVEAASVWMGAGRDHVTDVSSATTGPGGEFELEIGSRPVHLLARAGGHAPSRLVPIDPTDLPERPLVLVLSGQGGAVGGRVVDVAGSPVAGAFVDVELGARMGGAFLGGHSRYTPPPLRARTDADGRFRVEGVATGPAVVMARAPGLQAARSRAMVEAHSTAEVQLRLGVGGALTGRVTSAAGEPLEGVRLVARADQGLARVEAHTAADGTYRLAGLPPGEVRVRAEDQANGRAEQTLAVAEGEERRWDTVLAFEASIVGRLVDEHGYPLAQWIVIAEVPDGGVSPERTTSDDGAFELPCVRPDAHSLYAYRPGGIGAPSGEWGGLMPGGPPLRLEVHLADLRSSSVTGRVLARDGEPVAGAAVLAVVSRSLDVSGETFRTGDDGRFAAGPLLPGVYNVWIRAEGAPLVRAGRIDLQGGSEADLGEIRLPAPGWLTASLGSDDGRPLSTVQIALVDGTGVQIEFRTVDVSTDGPVQRFGPLAPGPYIVRASTGRRGPPEQEMEVVAGGDTPVQLVMPRDPLAPGG